MDIKNFLRDSKNQIGFEPKCVKAIGTFSFGYSDSDDLMYFDPRRNKSNPQITFVKPAVYVEVADIKISLDPKLSGIASEIRKSKYILELKDDWDDFGALAPSEIIYNRAVFLLVDY